jgi:hypothetical protein
VIQGTFGLIHGNLAPEAQTSASAASTLFSPTPADHSSI